VETQKTLIQEKEVVSAKILAKDDMPEGMLVKSF
jgi:hypothetical protein